MPISKEDAIIMTEMDALANKVAIPYTEKQAAHNAMKRAVKPKIKGNLVFEKILSFMGINIPKNKKRPKESLGLLECNLVTT